MLWRHAMGVLDLQQIMRFESLGIKNQAGVKQVAIMEEAAN